MRVLLAVLAMACSAPAPQPTPRERVLSGSDPCTEDSQCAVADCCGCCPPRACVNREVTGMECPDVICEDMCGGAGMGCAVDCACRAGRCAAIVRE